MKERPPVPLSTRKTVIASPALIAAVQEPARRIEGEAARVAAARPFFANERQAAVGPHGEDRDAVVEAVAGIDVPAVAGHQDLGAEIGPGKAGGQGRDRLSRGQASRRGIVVEQHDGGAFLLDRVEPAAIGVETEVPWSVSRRKGDESRIVRSQQAALLLELPDEDPVQAQVGVKHEASRGIGLDHVGVRPIVAADGEAAGRGVRRFRGADRTCSDLDVRSLAQPAVGQDWEHSHGTAEVVGHEQVVSARVHADIGRPGAARTHGVEQLQLSVGPIDGERGDAALLVVADPIGLVRGIEAGSVAAEGEATRARADLDNAEGRHRSGGAIDPKEMNATAIPGRQIHLGRERVAKRGAEGPDIADERRGTSARSGLFQEMSHRKDPCECG